MSLGTDKIKEVMKFGADLRNLTAEALADGKFQWQEAIKFLPTLMSVQGVIESLKETVAQIKDASHPEREELEVYAKDVLQIPAEQVEDFIAKSFDWVVATLQLIESGKNIA